MPKKTWTKADYTKAVAARKKRQANLNKAIKDLEKLRGMISATLTTLRTTVSIQLDPVPLVPADGPGMKLPPKPK